MKIDCQIDTEKKVKVFYVDGELDVHHVKSLKSEIMDSIESTGWTYELNMDKVAYLDSSGLGMLVYLKKEITRHNGKLRIVKLNEPVLNVFKLTKLDDFFELG
ncbi:MAG: STAS domain-containing protein [Candidatus Riflebacteria bacterium]|nr:STAS domain-containing protein [Candidatus Riflebacteria bacterium]